jgi:hypothetical protein
MLSNMESKPTRSEAATALRAAEVSRAAIADGVATPSWFFTSIVVAISVQIATTAVGLGDGPVWVLVAGLAVFAAVAGVQLARFRRCNGVWIGGFASRVVLGTGTAASGSYVIALAAAAWSALEEQWWLVALCALGGGGAYALSGLRWLRGYQAQPAVRARGESAAWLALGGAAALIGLALLMTSAR